MTKYSHIVQVHPVELDGPNLHKVKWECEFDTKEEAEKWVSQFNLGDGDGNTLRATKAVYVGCVNDETGELV